MRSEHTYALVTSRGSQWDKNAPQLQCPRAATRVGNAWVSKAISHRRKTSKLRTKTPTLGNTPNLESLLFLDVPQKLTGSGRNCDRNTGQNPIRKSSCLHYKLINFYSTGSQSSENSIPQSPETVAGGGRSSRRSVKRKPAKNLHFPATGAAADVGEGSGHDTGAEPVILAPVPCASVAGGRSCEGGGRQLSRGGEREHPRERVFQILFKIHFEIFTIMPLRVF
ncbi:unnamed protein product [Prunus armeniaca]